MNISNFALGAILSQPGEDDLLRPIKCHSHKFFLAKINYEIHNKELLAILMLLNSGIICFKDNMKLLCIQTTKTCNIS
jgi:hypothetical protein